MVGLLPFCVSTTPGKVPEGAALGNTGILSPLLGDDDPISANDLPYGAKVFTGISNFWKLDESLRCALMNWVGL